MTKVHPNAALAAISVKPASLAFGNTREEVLTVWRKSLLLNCNGFTVYDCKGNLVFRVDNYVSSNKGEVLLMDASGKPLLTIRRKRLSLGDSWQVFDGEGGAAAYPRFTARKHSNILNTKCLAQVSLGQGGSGTGSNSPSSPSSPSSWSSRSKNVVFEIEGSYMNRCCTVYDDKRRLVAEIKQKESVGSDVFRLVVKPEMDTAVAMALVILLDQMFGSSRRFSN